MKQSRQRVGDSKIIQKFRGYFNVIKILVVADTVAVSEGIVNHLLAEGYRCEAAKDLETAIEKVSLYNYDCVLLDIMLPDGNGLAVLEKLIPGLQQGSHCIQRLIAEHPSGHMTDMLDNQWCVYTHIKNLKMKLSERGCRDYIITVTASDTIGKNEEKAPQ